MYLVQNSKRARDTVDIISVVVFIYLLVFIIISERNTI